jgi:hypothetical protein
MATTNTRLPRKKKTTDKKLHERISALLAAFEKQIAENQLKMSVADYIRLLQVRRELEGDRPKDVIATWVDSLEEKKNTEE